MTLKTFNVFGHVVVNRNKVTIQYKTFQTQPMTLESEEGNPSLPAGATGEFMFGMSVDDKGYSLSTYETNPIDGIPLKELPVVVQYMDLIADSVRTLEKVL